MERLDVEMRQLYSELKAPELNEEQKEKLETNIKMREEILAPIYHQVTNQTKKVQGKFCDRNFVLFSWMTKMKIAKFITRKIVFGKFGFLFWTLHRIEYVKI